MGGEAGCGEWRRKESNLRLWRNTVTRTVLKWALNGRLKEASNE